MKYRIVDINHLMAYEFGLVEAGFKQLDENKLQSVVPSGMSFDEFIDQLQSGHAVLINDDPETPLLIQDPESQSWRINPIANDAVDSVAQNAYLSRSNMVGAASSPVEYPGSLHPALPMPPYYPEKPIPDGYCKTPPIQYEYLFEIACSNDALNATIGGLFQLINKKMRSFLTDGKPPPLNTELDTKQLATSMNR